MKISKRPNIPSAPEADAAPGYRFPFGRINFILICASLFLIILGFILMSGASSTTEAFNPDIFSTQRIVVGPMFSFIGYVLLAVGIIVKPKEG